VRQQRRVRSDGLDLRTRAVSRSSQRRLWHATPRVALR
jgi:hypothetical protein